MSDEEFRHFFDLYYGRVLHFFARRGFSHADCLDLTQETFLGIYKSRGSFRGEAKIETWMFTIAANTYRKALRHRAARKRAGQEVPLEDAGEGSGAVVEIAAANPPGAPEAERRLLGRESVRRLQGAVAGLPPRMRRCLVLRVVHGLKYREVAEVMHLSIDTVKAHLAQARQRLREALGQDFEDPDL